MNLEIGKGFKLPVYWYDHVPEPQRETTYEGEVIAWRNTQLIVRVRDYAVLRFWKRNGLEVGNGDAERRGFRVDLSELTPTTAAHAAPAPASATNDPGGVSVKLDA